MKGKQVDPIHPATALRIEAKLGQIERAEHVAIPLAVESGSRAWGFPSPDSDYDCRFIFVRDRTAYLSLWPRRDVIETPVEGELDVNGWDLAKAIRLLAKGNAVVIEWLTSPITYRSDDAFRASFLELADRVASRDLIGRHYLHLGERQRRTYFRDTNLIPGKKIFYALRPAVALRWLRHHPTEAVAPMNFPTLIRECEAPEEVIQISMDLVARKSTTRELGEQALPEPIGRFIDEEFQIATRLFDVPPMPTSGSVREACNDFFESALAKFGKC